MSYSNKPPPKSQREGRNHNWGPKEGDTRTCTRDACGVSWNVTMDPSNEPKGCQGV